MTITKQALNAAVRQPVRADGTFAPEFVRLLQAIIADRKTNVGVRQPITISGGSISISTAFSYYQVDTESAAASDDLDTIANGNEGDLIFIEAADAARTVVLKDGTGNILTDGSTDLSLDNTQDLALLLFDGANWKASLWNIGT